MAEPKKRTPVSAVFSHLSEEERIDKGCELLAIGVMRLAEKRGLLAQKKTEEISKEKTGEAEPLHKSQSLKKDIEEAEMVL